MNIKRVFLPIGYLYGAITSLRNFLFRVKILKKYHPPIFTLSVGNLQVGGTGKTPHVEYLIELLENEEIAVLSRGYGRKTKGFLKADENSSANTVGDESYQIYSKYFNKVNVYVCEDRPKGVLEIIKDFKPSVILLDDAFQHQYIVPHLNLLLSTFELPFTQDEMLPAGRLREFKKNANRADAIVITKEPENTDSKSKELLIKEIKVFFADTKPIFFSNYVYKTVVPYGKSMFEKSSKTVLISGIANPELFVNYATKNFNVIAKYQFKDHHIFSHEEIDVFFKAHGKVQYLTTEKDYVKIAKLLPIEHKKLFFYLPIKVSFDEESKFNEFILTSFASHQTS